MALDPAQLGGYLRCLEIKQNFFIQTRSYVYTLQNRPQSKQLTQQHTTAVESESTGGNHQPSLSHSLSRCLLKLQKATFQLHSNFFITYNYSNLHQINTVNLTLANVDRLNDNVNESHFKNEFPQHTNENITSLRN